MNHAANKIVEEAITTTNPNIKGILSMLDAKDEKNSECMDDIDHKSATPNTIHSVVLPMPSLIHTSINLAIEAI
jgi:hypothetical protein